MVRIYSRKDVDWFSVLFSFRDIIAVLGQRESEIDLRITQVNVLESAFVPFLWSAVQRHLQASGFDGEFELWNRYTFSSVQLPMVETLMILACIMLLDMDIMTKADSIRIRLTHDDTIEISTLGDPAELFEAAARLLPLISSHET